MKSILFVCLGNICRSPLAEGILRKKLAENNSPVIVDSAGTINWHEGHPPDSRSIKVASQFGIDISGLRGRHFTWKDYMHFDLILAMDRQNLSDILKLAPDHQQKSKVRLCLEFSGLGNDRDVPDPYYGNMADFLDLYQLLDKACDQMLLKLNRDS